MYSELMELGAFTIAANKELRSDAADLRAQASAVRRRALRFRPMCGASEARDDARARRLLRDFCAVLEPPKSFVGYSRGSVCQACGNNIKTGDIEYDVAAGMSEMRLDVDCYRIFIEESLAASAEGLPDAESA